MGTTCVKLSRFLWLALAAFFLIIFPWLDQHHGGDAELTFSCALSASRVEGADADVVIFGSSRTGAAFDQFYIESILAQSFPDSHPKVERLNFNGPDPMSAYFLLENRLKYGEAPDILVLELMLRLDDDEQDRDRSLHLRHHTLLTVQQLKQSLLNQLADQSDVGLHDYFTLYVDRYTALLHGLIKHPRNSFWDHSLCSEPEAWSRKGRWASAEREAQGDAHYEAGKAARMLVATESEAAIRIRGLSRFDEFDNVLSYQSKLKIADAARIEEINLLTSLIDLAEMHGTRVLLTPLMGFRQQLSEQDKAAIIAAFPSVYLLDIMGEADEYLGSHWRDPNHVTKSGSMLTSALLASSLLEEMDE